MLINLFWLSAPKALKVTIYIGLGWLVRETLLLCQRDRTNTPPPGVQPLHVAHQCITCPTLFPQVLPYAPQMKEALGPVGAWLVTAGGIAYTVGAIIYARRYPDPWVRINSLSVALRSVIQRFLGAPWRRHPEALSCVCSLRRLGTTRCSTPAPSSRRSATSQPSTS